ncbi:hypothetical protein [Tamlana sp. I1]|uniref:hypothetical protein n=1 Tax=Tamlana sp. I1 TaxID=2762061 RepID=UPI00188F4FDA|nr:hypothetical protein [Tamlana sp. I1]
MKNIFVFSLIFFIASNLSYSQQIRHPKAGVAGSWKLIGTTQANLSADYDAIIVKGPFDDFRRIKFKVTLY